MLIHVPVKVLDEDCIKCRHFEVKHDKIELDDGYQKTWTINDLKCKWLVSCNVTDKRCTKRGV